VSRAHAAEARAPRLRDGAAVQARVIGALMMRELHTRFGRRNLGYVWLFLEPLILGLLITLLFRASRGNGQTAIPMFDFFAIGYSLYFIFRSVVSRATGAIRSNTMLLYHRPVTPADFFYARHLLEAAAAVTTMALLTAGAVVVADSEWPSEPLLMFGAAFLMLWLAHGLGMIFAAAAEEWEVADRLLPPLTYIMMPISGVFFLLAWMPPELQRLLAWNPMVHIFEMLREGQFGARVVTTWDPFYVVAWAMGLHLLGLCAIRIVRRRLGRD